MTRPNPHESNPMNDKEYKTRLKALNAKYPKGGKGRNKVVRETDRAEAIALHTASKGQGRGSRRASDIPFGSAAVCKWKRMNRSRLVETNEKAIDLDKFTSAVINRSDQLVGSLMQSTAPKPLPGTIGFKLGAFEITGLTFSELKRFIRWQSKKATP